MELFLLKLGTLGDLHLYMMLYLIVSLVTLIFYPSTHYYKNNVINLFWIVSLYYVLNKFGVSVADVLGSIHYRDVSDFVEMIAIISIAFYAFTRFKDTDGMFDIIFLGFAPVVLTIFVLFSSLVYASNGGYISDMFDPLIEINKVTDLFKYVLFFVFYLIVTIGKVWVMALTSVIRG